MRDFFIYLFFTLPPELIRSQKVWTQVGISMKHFLQFVLLSCFSLLIFSFPICPSFLFSSLLCLFLIVCFLFVVCFVFPIFHSYFSFFLLSFSSFYNFPSYSFFVPHFLHLTSFLLPTSFFSFLPLFGPPSIFLPRFLSPSFISSAHLAFFPSFLPSILSPFQPFFLPSHQWILTSVEISLNCLS